MEKNIQMFQYEEKAIRTITINGEPWWVAKDVCAILKYANTTDAVKTHCKGIANSYPLQTPGGVQETRIISESDLYRLIVKSTLPEAEKFEKWIFETVLPSIRKTGKYDVTQKSDDELILIGYEKLMERVKVLSEENKALDSQVKKLVHDPKTYTTTELAKELHMRSAQELNEKLKDKGIQYKINNTWVLTSEYSENGYTETKQLEKDGVTIYNTQWTGIGRQFIIDLFPKSNQRCA